MNRPPDLIYLPLKRDKLKTFLSNVDSFIVEGPKEVLGPKLKKVRRIPRDEFPKLGFRDPGKYSG